ncbi:non-ribosomal peptide synthetase [Larkinella sp. VNQ87]|uniref:non-ribosomal peptide synthetase n=1 Tax=Larkinella sp. VNQ87 TaxID=3400921 RepID=UPI003BFDE627
MVDFKVPVSVKAVDYNPFAGPEIERLIPTSEPQLEIGMACLLGGNDASRAYNESVSLHFRGVPDRTALETAVQQLVRRHKSLRAAFSADARQMIVFRDQPVAVHWADLSERSSAEQAQAVADYVRQEAEFCFDLVHGPLFKVSLLKASPYESHLILTAHHIVCDGWSMGILMQELSALYSAHVQNQFVALPDPVSFSQYAAEQAVFEQSADYARIEAFWLDQYKPGVPVVDVPTDFPRPSPRTYQSERLDFELDATLVAALKTMGRQAGCSFVTTLVTAFDAWLHRLTGQQTIAIGLPAAGQSATGHYRLIGHCVNLLPLRSELTESVRFIDFLKRRKSELLAAYDHQRLTFGRLLKKLGIARDPARIPLVPVVFNVDMGLADGVDFYGLSYQLSSNPRAYENFEIFLNATGSETALTLEWSYNTQLFTAETIHRMMAGFENLLRTLVADPAVRVDTLTWAVVDTPDQTSDGPETTTPYPSETPLHRLLAETATRFPEKTALEFHYQQFSYRHLHETANQLAHYLINHGIRPGDVVGVSVSRSPEMLITLLAVMKSGAAYLPLDPLYPHDRLAFMLTDSAARMLVTSRKYAGRLNIPAIERVVEDALTEAAVLPTTEPGIPLSGSDLLYMLYTSGSTGQPKGVLIEHHNMVNLLMSMVAWPGLTSDDRLLAITTISFDIAGVELFLPLLTGATIVLTDTDTTRDGRLLLELLENERISVIQATPATYRMMLAAGWETALPLKVLCGGEPMSKDLAEKLTARSASLWNLYGPTETTIYSTGKQILPSDPVITIGRPIQNTQVYILDADGNRLGVGSVGEITLAGEGVARGYHNRPELTAEKFVENRFGPGLLYRTGDLGKWTADGEIHCLGRIDQQVKIRGYRIEPGEIESVLIGADDIREAVVVAREDRPGDPHLIAYVVPKTAPTETPVLASPDQKQQWKQRARAALPKFMVPTEFVLLAQLPLTPNGKIDRQALPKPDEKRPASEAGRGRTPEEELVAAIWSDALGLETIQDTDDFFELGGHSLVAVEVMTRIEKETGKRLPLSTLFQYPTIRKLAILLQKEERVTTWKCLVPIKPTGTRPPIYFVHGDGLNVLIFKGISDHMDPDQPVYGFQALGLDGQDEPLESIEAMAAFYVGELLEQNPTGPYNLAGYSFGGYIAVEMARLLDAKGKKVNMVIMLDTDAEIITSKSLTTSTLYKRLRRQYPKLKWLIGSFFTNPAETVAYQKLYLTRRINGLLIALGLREKPTEVPLQMSGIYEKQECAYRNYVLRPFNGHVVLLRADKRVYFVMDFTFLGWKKYALQGVTVYEVSGDHRTMFDAPNDQKTARVIQEALIRREHETRTS